MRRLLRGSSSQSSKEKALKPKYNLPRTAEVRACEWPSEDFLRAVEFMKIFMNWLRLQALPLSSTTNVVSISCSQIHLCKTFIFITWAAIQAYKNPAPAPEQEPQDEPPRQSVYSWDPEMTVSQWQSESSSSSQYDPNYSSSSQYDPNNYYYGYPPGQPWP